jgi:hypothetical protein
MYVERSQFCKYCNGPITFRRSEKGHTYPIHLGGGECPADALFDSRVELSVPASFPASCPICSAGVFFVRHNSGSVWLDDLGPPWPIHGCFEKSSSMPIMDEVMSDYETRYPGFSIAVVEKIHQQKPGFATSLGVGERELVGMIRPFEGADLEAALGEILSGITKQVVQRGSSGGQVYWEYSLSVPIELEFLLNKLGMPVKQMICTKAHVDYFEGVYEVFGFGDSVATRIKTKELAEWAIEESAGSHIASLGSTLVEAISKEADGAEIDFFNACGINLDQSGWIGQLKPGSLLLVSPSENRVVIEGFGLSRFDPTLWCCECGKILLESEMPKHQKSAH